MPSLFLKGQKSSRRCRSSSVSCLPIPARHRARSSRRQEGQKEGSVCELLTARVARVVASLLLASTLLLEAEAFRRCLTPQALVR